MKHFLSHPHSINIPGLSFLVQIQQKIKKLNKETTENRRNSKQ